MGETSIEWADYTFNPWHGCVRVSPACDHCYAERLDDRRLWGGESVWGKGARRRFFGEELWRKPVLWNKKAKAEGKRRRVFCASMADVFELLPKGHPDRDTMKDTRKRLWQLIRDTPYLDWMLLTKRPKFIPRMLPTAWMLNPQPNVWLGVTAEMHGYKPRRRIEKLACIPAAIRFVSAEPLLGPLNLHVESYLPRQHVDGKAMGDVIHWLIVGGESGPKARPTHPAWVRAMRDTALREGLAFLFKQWGEWTAFDVAEPARRALLEPVYLHSCGLTWDELTRQRQKSYDVDTHPEVVKMVRVGKHAAGRELDGRTWDEFPTVDGIDAWAKEQAT